MALLLSRLGPWAVRTLAERRAAVVTPFDALTHSGPDSMLGLGLEDSSFRVSNAHWLCCTWLWARPSSSGIQLQCWLQGGQLTALCSPVIWTAQVVGPYSSSVHCPHLLGEQVPSGA